MMSPLLQLFLRWLVIALGVTLATKIVPGITCSDGTTLLAVVVLLSFFNAILKPLLVLFTLQWLFSQWWLARHAQGPMEALWRRWTYGRAAAAV